MGDDFIKKKTQNYRRQAEKIHAQEFGQSGVSSGAPERTAYVFRFQCPGVDPMRGEEIWLADVPGKPGVRVMQGTNTIGEVDAAGSTKFRALIAENKTAGGFVPGVIAGEKDVAGYAKAKISL
jgi:hypothetical protein